MNECIFQELSPSTFGPLFIAGKTLKKMFSKQAEVFLQAAAQINWFVFLQESAVAKSMASIVLALHILPLQHFSTAKLFLVETEGSGTER